MEGDTGEGKANNHTGRREQHDLAPPDNIDVLQRNKGKDEVRAGDDEPNGRRLVEAYLLEQRCRVVHERVKAAELLEGLHPTADDCNHVRIELSGVRDKGLTESAAVDRVEEDRV